MDEALALVPGEPAVRLDVVERARLLIEGGEWCRAEEVAATLVECLVRGKVP